MPDFWSYSFCLNNFDICEYVGSEFSDFVCLIVCLFLIYFWSIFLLDMQFLVDLFFCFFKYFKGITAFSSNFFDFWLEVCYKYFLPLCVMFFWSFFPPSHCFQDFLSFFFFSSLFLAFFSRCTHSSVLAWRIPGIGDRGGLPSVGLHRVGHDWSDAAAAAAAYQLVLLHTAFLAGSFAVLHMAFRE